MVVSEVAKGLALGAFGVGFYAFARWSVNNDKWLQQGSRARWGWDRRTVRALRTGEVSQAEWFERFARSQRQLVKWVFTPFIAVWVAICLGTAIHGLIS